MSVAGPPVEAATTTIGNLPPLRAGIGDGVTTAVEGLQVGEMVALSSFDKLQEGTPVKVEPSPQKALVNAGVQP